MTYIEDEWENVIALLKEYALIYTGILAFGCFLVTLTFGLWVVYACTDDPPYYHGSPAREEWELQLFRPPPPP